MVGNITQRIDRTKTTSTTTSFAHPAAGQPRPHFTTSTTSTGATPGTRTYTADVAGNTATRTHAGQTQTLAWDTENKLDAITVAGSQVQQNVYDASGNRIVRREATQTTLYSPAGEITLTHATGELTANRYYTFGGKTIALRTGPALNTLTYTLGDHQDTTHIQVNAETRATSTRWNAPYGNIRATTGSWAGQRDYVGGTTDAAIGLVHIGARDYDTHLNQFITTDPILQPGIPASLHAYSYAHNNPTTLSDPTGLLPWGNLLQAGRDFLGGVVHAATTAWGFVFYGNAHANVDNVSASQPARNQARKQITRDTRTYEKRLKTTYRKLGVNYGSTAFKIGEWAGALVGGATAARKIATKAATTIANRVAPKKTPVAIPPRMPAITPRAPAAAAKSVAKQCSFSGATLVVMADNSRQPINEIKVGDKVQATDPETGETEARQVTALWVHEDTLVDLQFEGGAVVTTTEDHPFWNATDHLFQRADQLVPGDEILTADGQHITARGLVAGSQRRALAYNLTVEGIHTYFVGIGNASALVHNTCAWAPDALSQSGSRPVAKDLTRAGQELAKHAGQGNFPVPNARRARSVVLGRISWTTF